MLPSYWATAMCLRVSASDRLALLRPALKIGSVSLGANCQTPLPEPNRSEKLLAVLPMSVVSCTDGKRPRAPRRYRRWPP